MKIKSNFEKLKQLIPGKENSKYPIISKPIGLFLAISLVAGAIFAKKKHKSSDSSSKCNDLSTSKVEAMRNEINWLEKAFINQCPLAVRKIEMGLPWREKVAKIRDSISNQTTHSEYCALVRDLINAINDPHVSVEFKQEDTLQHRHIPLTFYTVDEKLFVHHVLDHDIDVKPHDEVISIDGHDPMSYLQKFAENNFGNWNQDRIKKLSASSLLYRDDKNGFLPTGSVHLKLKNEEGSAARSLSLSWKDGKGERPWLNDDKLYLPLPGWKDVKGIVTLPGIEVRRVKFDDQHCVGYLRIEDFVDLEGILDRFINTFVECLKILDKETELLIIDLRNNDGGTEVVLNIVADHLIGAENQQYPRICALDSTMVDRIHRQIKSCDNRHEDYQRSKSDIDKLPAEKQVVINKYFSNILLERENYVNYLERLSQGHKISSSHVPALSLLGEQLYNKPVIVLINESTGSSAEMLAAKLHDFGKATIFGSKSAGGGGGYDLTFQEPDEFKGPYIISKLHCPNLLTLRATPNSEENFVVIPNIEYKMTSEDYNGTSSEYSDRLNLLIKKTLKNQS